MTATTHEQNIAEISGGITICINSVYTPNICAAIAGNHTDDWETSWSNIRILTDLMTEEYHFYVPGMGCENITIAIPSISFYIPGIGTVKILYGFGHYNTALYIKEKQGFMMPFLRSTLKMSKGYVVVPAYHGRRLPEGATELPKGAKIVPMVTRINI